MFSFSVRSLPAIGFAVATTALLSSQMVLAEPAPPYESLISRLDEIPSTLEAEALREAAAARVQQARARPNPTIGLESADAYGGGPFAGYGRAETTLSVSQPLELWGQRGARVEAAQAEADATGLRSDQQRWLTAGRIALAYAQAEAAIRRYDLAAEALALTEDDGRAVAALVNEGREAELRGVQAQSETEASRAALDAARANRDSALAQLTAVAMLEELATSVDGTLLDRTPPSSGASDELLAVKVAAAEVDAAKHLVTVEKLRARPSVTATLGVRRYEEFATEAYTVGVSVTVPIFNRNKGSVNAALAEQRAAEARLLTQRLETQAARRAAEANLTAADSRTRAADSGVAAAEEAYELARVGFDAGRISQLELRSSRASLISSHNSAVDARLSRVLAEIDLARLEGRAPFGGTP